MKQASLEMVLIATTTVETEVTRGNSPIMIKIYS